MDGRDYRPDGRRRETGRPAPALPLPEKRKKRSVPKGKSQIAAAQSVNPRIQHLGGNLDIKSGRASPQTCGAADVSTGRGCFVKVIIPLSDRERMQNAR